MKSIYKKTICCASCNNPQLNEILDLHDVPLAGFFPSETDIHEQCIYPLKLMICPSCKLVQTDSCINPDTLFKDYRYMSSIGLSNHFKDLAMLIDSRYDIKNKQILEIGCNDGALLEPLSNIGAIATGVDPSANICKITKAKGLNVINSYFSYDNFNTSQHKNTYDLVLSNNAFAHIIDVTDVVKGIKNVLKSDGHFIFEVHYLKNLIDENQWDNVYHEHIYYYSITALHNLFHKFNMTVIDFEDIPILSRSIRVIVQNTKTKLPTKITDRINDESNNICNLEYLQNYNQQVKQHIEDFKTTIKQLSTKYKIAGYGASGRANMFCNLTGLNKDIIKFIVDESPERCNRYIANLQIPVVDIETLKNSDVDLLIIFAWNYSKMIIDKTKFKQFKYLVAFPSVQIVNDYDQLNGFNSI